jgi:hypothetical protein
MTDKLRRGVVVASGLHSLRYKYYLIKGIYFELTLSDIKEVQS